MTGCGATSVSDETVTQNILEYGESLFDAPCADSSVIIATGCKRLNNLTGFFNRISLTYLIRTSACFIALNSGYFDPIVVSETTFYHVVKVHNFFFAHYNDRSRQQLD